MPTQVATAIAGDRTATLTLLAGAAGLAILLTFVNLAGLLVVRAIDRRRELAVRTALGAGPADVAWQVVLESGAIVAAGTLGGLWLGWWGAPVVANLIVERVAGQPEMSVALSGRITGGLVLLSGLCAVVCSVWPAMYATRWNLVTMLRHAATPSPRERLLRRAFVVGEVALACVLVASTSLIGRALVALLDVTPGFDARGVLALQVSLPRASYPDGLRASAFYATLQSALTERLGPREVAVVDELPLTGLGRRRLLSARPGEAQREVVVRAASLAYFEVMRIPVVAGRTFDATDSALATVRRVVVSASLAEQLFGSAPAVGRTVWLLPEAVTAEVIGVVGDVLHRALDDVASPTLYESFLQEPSRSSVLVVQSRRPPADVTAIVREEAGKLDAALPVYRVRSLEDVVSASPGLPARRLLTAALTAFGVLALLLSAVGLFGVVAHDVASRRTELGLRLALGASPTRLLLRTVGQGLMLVAAGLGVGSVLTAWALNALGAAIHSGEGRADVFNVGVAAAVLITVGVISVLPPARRAAKTNPLAVLRGE